MLTELTIKEFINKVLSNDPVPGGGSVSALNGALATSLAAMVANLTIGRKKYVEVNEIMEDLSVRFEELTRQLITDVDRDSEAYDRVFSAFKLPKETDEEKAIRSEAYGKMLEFYNLRSDEITAKDVIAIVKKWQEAVVGLDKMVYADAKKEFSLSAMTGFGADGSREEMEQDFEQVRGVFESNPFVTAVLQHIEAKTALGNELIERIASI